VSERPQGASDQRRTLRQLTLATAIAAVALNLVLLVQTTLSTPGSGDVQDAIISLLGGVFPGGGLRAAPSPPAAAPTASPHAVTGAS